MSVERTDWDSLWEIAKRRGIRNPAECRVMCGACGVELVQGVFGGLIHWEDCDGEWSSILFLAQDEKTGAWKEQGGGRVRSLADSLLVFFGG